MENVMVKTPQSLGIKTLGGTILNDCDGLTYTHLLDNGYGLTPITPSNSSENTPVTPSRTQSVKRRLVLEDGSVDEEGFRTPIKTPKRSRQKSVSAHYIPASPSRQQRNASPSKVSRYDTSLGKLTKEFVSLLQSAEDGTIDLNKASDTLSVQKRRIYDITNVLEGVGLVNKKSKNNVQWTPSNFECKALEKNIADLESKENELDDLIKSAEHDLLQLSQNKHFAYITYQDLHTVKEYKDNTVFAIKAPPGTQLTVPQGNDDSGYKIHLKSENGPIEVFLSDADRVTSPKKEVLTTSELPSTPAKVLPNISLITPKKEPCSPSFEKLLKTESALSFAKEDSTSYANTSLNLDYESLGSSLMLNSEGAILPLQIDQQSIGASDFCLSSSTSPPPFLSLEPPLTDSDYTFSLDHTEGLSDLFDFNFC